MSFPIGIFDSGVGGITVLKEIVKTVPPESIIYFGDTARLPYGDKSPQTIQKYTREGIRFLVEQGVKMVVIACNTASAYSAQLLRHETAVPVVDVIGPSAEEACLMTSRQRIAVLGTHATIRSGCYPDAIHAILPSAQVTSIACPLFVPLVEEGLTSHPAALLFIRDYLQQVIEQECDTVILGCTHYPLLKEAIRRELPADTVLVDSAECCARRVCELLRETHFAPHPSYDFFVTDDSARFRLLAERLLEGIVSINQVELCIEQQG